MATFSQSTIDKGSEVVKDFCCLTCEEKKIEEFAEFYCETCLKCFCGKCFHLHDQLYTRHTTCGRREMKKWPVSKVVEDFLQKCEVHKDEKLKMFCKDHSQLCCTNCVLLNHRQCTQVILISGSVKTQPTDLQQLSVNLQTILEQIEKLKKNWEASIQSVEGSYNEQLQEVQETRRTINATLDKIEHITLKAMKDTLTSLQASLKTDVNKCSRLQDELKQLHEAIKDISDKSKEELSFIASKKCLDKIQQSEKFLKENSVQVESSITFYANRDIEKYLSTLSILGRIVHSTDQVFSVKGKTEHKVKISSDSSACHITGICVLPNGQILVADSNNKKVKLLDEQYHVVSDCGVSDDPWDMCQITPSEVAVTIGKEVQFITVNKGQLVKGRKLQLQRDCVGIAYHQGDLYVTSGTALYKHTLSGKLVSKLYTSDSYTVWKCAVSPNGDRIYITNQSQHKLLALARDGSVLATFTDPELRYPRSVHVTPAGQVLVCGGLYPSYMYYILQVDREGRKKLATLATGKDGAWKPESVCYNSNTASIIVGQLKNKMVVFKVE